MDIGAPELLIILLIVLLLFGPGRIAKTAGEMGSAIRSFRKGLSGEDEKDNPEKKETPSSNEPIA